MRAYTKTHYANAKANSQSSAYALVTKPSAKYSGGSFLRKSYARQTKREANKYTHPTFKGVPEQFEVASLPPFRCIIDETMPSELIVTSITDDGEVMSVEHKDYPILRCAIPSGIHHDINGISIRNFILVPGPVLSYILFVVEDGGQSSTG